MNRSSHNLAPPALTLVVGSYVLGACITGLRLVRALVNVAERLTRLLLLLSEASVLLADDGFVTAGDNRESYYAEGAALEEESSSGECFFCHVFFLICSRRRGEANLVDVPKEPSSLSR